jgi:3-oxoacyl-[acyl-carrier-protein] synthase II
MTKRRVVVTGIGTVNALGNNVNEFWDNARNGKIGIDYISSFDTTDYKVKVAAEVKNFDAKKSLPLKLVKRSERFVHLALKAAQEAMEDSGLCMEQEDAYRIGVCVSSAIGGLSRIAQESLVIETKGPNKVNPFTVPLVIANMACSNIAMMFGMQGKCFGLVSACATGTDSIGEAYHTIMAGQSDVMLAGGSDSIVCPQGISSFQQLTALTIETDPEKASIPFDKDRSGFVMGEGAGVLILEELEHARKRNATIYGEILGYGCTNDAYHITTPREDGEAAAKAMELALENAGILPEQIDYINAHGTSTHFNDLYETRAMKKVFSKHAQNLSVNSTKSMVGHTLAGAGAIEAIVCLLAIRDSFVHVTAGLKNEDEECDLDYTKGVGKERNIKFAMSNSFGFGGHNSSLIIAEFEEER